MAGYELRSANVVADVIDGEVLAIRSDTGSYYSMRGSAATTWCALITAADLDNVCLAVATHHGAEPTIVATDVRAYAERLVGEQLLVHTDRHAEFDVDLPTQTAGTTWNAPEFEAYTDMQDLLLFDPIHEVQPTGWPDAARDTG